MSLTLLARRLTFVAAIGVLIVLVDARAVAVSVKHVIVVPVDGLPRSD